MNLEQNVSLSSWLTHAREISDSTPHGQFSTVYNKLPIILEWEYLDPKSQRFNEKVKSLSQLLINAYSKIELEFAEKKPEAIANDVFLKSLEPLPKNEFDIINWKAVQNQITQILKGFFTQNDWSLYSKQNDLHYFVVAKEQETGKQLGMVQFVISPEYDIGTVKIELYDGIFINDINHDLQKILLSSIFKLIPGTKRLFFHTRATNLNGIQAHMALGFNKFSGNLPNWIDLEYIAEQSQLLQKFSHNLK